MKRKHEEAQKYVLLAKKRLVNNDYGDFGKTDEERYYINNRKLTKDQVERMNEAVAEILASDTLVYDALSRLIVDKTEFSALEEPNRVKYIFELSKIYAKLRLHK